MDEKKGFVRTVISKLFRGFNANDANTTAVSVDSGVASSSTLVELLQNRSDNKLNNADGWQTDYVLPNDRQAKYRAYELMGKDELLSAALQMHVAHALAPDMRNGRIVTISSDNPEFKKLAAEVMDDIGDMINRNCTGWAMLMAQYGVHYIRPYGEQGKGITDIESNYFTLATHIKEYERAGLLCGFTSEYLKKKNGTFIQLAEPWVLVPCKIPYWTPKMHEEPIVSGGQTYSLYTEIHRRAPVESQNYGTSFFESAYGAWMELRESLTSLRGSRYLASKHTQTIGVGMDGLDPVSSSQYVATIGKQLRKDLEAEAAFAKAKQARPSVWTRILPILTGGKGGMTIDNQQVSPDIKGIEDVIFNLKRVCSAMGIDPSMIGWADLMNGGLGEGGWARTSVIAAQRANWIRLGVRDCVQRLIEIHIAYKYGQTFPTGNFPLSIEFHSINSSLAIEQAEERKANIEYMTNVVTLLDLIKNSTVSSSPTLMREAVMAVGFLDEQADQVLKEINQAKSTTDNPEKLMESVINIVDSHLDNLLTNEV